MIEVEAGLSVLDFLCAVSGRVRAIQCTCSDEFTHRLNVHERCRDPGYDPDDDEICISVSKIKRYANSRSRYLSDKYGKLIARLCLSLR